MLEVVGDTILLDNGDYGLGVTLSFTGDIEGIDSVEFRVKKRPYDEECLLTKTFNGLDGDGTVLVEFTQEDSKALPPGDYVWGVKLRRGAEELNTAVQENRLRVRRCV